MHPCVGRPGDGAKRSHQGRGSHAKRIRCTRPNLRYAVLTWTFTSLNNAVLCTRNLGEKRKKWRGAGRETETETSHFGFAGVTDKFVNLTQVKIIKEEVPIRYCLPWAGLWACPWRTVLIKSIDVGRFSPLWEAPFPKQKPLNYMRVETWG